MLTGLALAFALVIGVEILGNAVHPFPADFDNTHQALCAHVERIPAWFLALAIVLWGGLAGVSAWVALRVGAHRAAAFALALLLFAAVLLNVSMLPYPWWFTVGALVAVPSASLWASLRGRAATV